jgi:hypothetical protein
LFLGIDRPTRPEKKILDEKNEILEEKRKRKYSEISKILLKTGQ